MTTPSAGLEQPADMARRLVLENAYLTLATADDRGHPWATPVWYAARDCDEFFWVSRPRARHSRNIAANSEVSIVIFDSRVPVGGAAAVYAEALAEEVTAGELTTALAVYSGHSEERGIQAWREADVTGSAPHRLYRARVSRVYVLGEGDERIQVTKPADFKTATPSIRHGDRSL